MAEKKLPMQFDIPGELTDSRPWIGKTGTSAQGCFAAKSEGITEEGFVQAFFNGTNQTFVFRK